MLACMRWLAVLALVLAIGVAACGGANDAGQTTWSGPQRPYPADGVLPVDGFRAYGEERDEEWEHARGALARACLRLDARAQAGPEVPSTTVSREGSRVTVTRGGLADDSGRAERYVLELQREGEIWSLVSARWEQRCQ